MRTKIVLRGIAALFALVAMMTVASAAENMVWLEPESSSADYCSTTEVEVWANITNTSGCAGGTIYLSYGSECANVTNWADNSAAWGNGTWDTSVDGYEWITFANLTPNTGKVLIGTLTIHCNSTSKCETPLEFIEQSVRSVLYYPPTPGEDEPGSGPLNIEGHNGTFSCVMGGMCGDVAPYPNCNEKVDMGDVILLLNNVSYPENPKYVLCNEWAGDCRCSDKIDMGDVILLLNNVSYPENPKYVLDCCETGE